MSRNMMQLRSMLAPPWVPASMGKAPYLWAFSLVFLLTKYVRAMPGSLELVALIVTILVFLPLYFASFWAPPRRLLVIMALTCLFGVLWAPFNFSAFTFFTFAGAMCAGIHRPRMAYLGLGIVLALSTLTSLTLGNYAASFALPSQAIVLTVGLASIMDATLRRSREQLLRKQEEVEHMATIAERERISRDLHDLLGHTLSLITLKAELAGKLAARDPAAAMQEIGDIETCARNALAEVRAAVTGYRLTGLQHELASARASLDAAGVTMEAQVEPFALPAAAENVIALALREAVTNIIRHAGASRCDVSLGLESGMIVLRIADNGVLNDAGGPLKQGNGLTGMKERVDSLGGQLAMRVSQGLALELRLPMGAGA
jgi:two-component system sensor histidine kinase DesK